MVEAPNGIAGVPLGNFGVSTALADVVEAEGLQIDGSAGSGESGLYDQRFFANASTSFVFVGKNQSTSDIGVCPLVEGLSDSTSIVANQVGWDNDTPFSPDTHAIQSQHDALLLGGQEAGLSGAIVNESVAYETPIGNGGALVDECAIAVSNRDLCTNSSSGSSDGTVADLDIFKLQQVALEPLVGLDALSSEGSRLRAELFVVQEAAGLSKEDGQEN